MKTNIYGQWKRKIRDDQARLHDAYAGLMARSKGLLGRFAIKDFEITLTNSYSHINISIVYLFTSEKHVIIVSKESYFNNLQLRWVNQIIN